MLIERLALGRDRLDGFDLLRSREEDVLPGAVASGARLGLGLGHHDDLQRQQVPVNVQAHQAATGGADYFFRLRLFFNVVSPPPHPRGRRAGAEGQWWLAALIIFCRSSC